jgi:hypothetical protein
MEIKWSASRPGHFTPRERARSAHWIGGWVGPTAPCLLSIICPIAKYEQRIQLARLVRTESQLPRNWYTQNDLKTLTCNSPGISLFFLKQSENKLLLHIQAVSKRIKIVRIQVIWVRNQEKWENEARAKKRSMEDYRSFSLVAYSSTLKREAVGSSETFVLLHHTTRCYVPEHSHLL